MKFTKLCLSPKATVLPLDLALDAADAADAADADQMQGTSLRTSPLLLGFVDEAAAFPIRHHWVRSLAMSFGDSVSR